MVALEKENNDSPFLLQAVYCGAIPRYRTGMVPIVSFSVYHYTMEIMYMSLDHNILCTTLHATAYFRELCSSVS